MNVRSLSLLVALAFSVSPETSGTNLDAKPLQVAEPIFQDDFSLTGNASGPLDQANRCFKIGTLTIPTKNLPKGRRLVLKMRIYCEEFGRPPERVPGCPGKLQLDVTSQKGNRRISQCQFETGKKWIAAEIFFSVTENSAKVALYNKWTQEPLFVDNVSVQLAPKKKVKEE